MERKSQDITARIFGPTAFTPGQAAALQRLPENAQIDPH
jgi:hypothetical protein